LFIKFWLLPTNPVYKVIPLVGNKEGVSGSTIGGTNIGINKFISDSRKRLAAKALQFMTSKEIQKKILLKLKSVSAIHSLYDDEEVCAAIDCELIKNIQPIARPNPKIVSYDLYSEKFRKYISDFLYEDKSAPDILNKIENIEKIYEINITSPLAGIIIFVLVIISLLMILFTLPFLFIKKYKPYFRFLSTDFWIFVLFGLVLHLIVILINYGELTKTKCQLRYILWLFGFTFYFIPLFHSFIENFPKERKYLIINRNYKYLFLIFFILIDIILSKLYLSLSTTPEIKFIENGKNYRVCKLYINNYGKYLYLVSLIEKGLIVIAMLILAFHEWNIWKILKDVRSITVAILIDIFLYALYIFMISINITHYIAFYLFYSLIILIFVLSNYAIIYGVRIIRILTNNDADILFIEALSKNSLDLESSSNEMFPSNYI